MLSLKEAEARLPEIERVISRAVKLRAQSKDPEEIARLDEIISRGKTYTVEQCAPENFQKVPDKYATAYARTKLATEAADTKGGR